MMRIIGVGLLAVYLLSGCSAERRWQKSVDGFQQELNAHYKHPEDSPLEEADRKTFTSHNFFPADRSYCVEADFVATPDTEPFEMPTVSGKTKLYRKYGELHFRLKGRADTLTVYQNIKNMDHPEYGKLLFLPFRDESSGHESYGGGRYIDLPIPTGDKVQLDFNQCYNPYCAYSSGWNCPIPPAENFVNSKVLAGVSKWKDGH